MNRLLSNSAALPLTPWIARRLTALTLLTGGLLLAGCQSKSEKPPEQESEPPKPAEPAAVPEPTPAPAAKVEQSEPKTVVDGVPTVEDFEEEAEDTITEDNLEAELDRLEKEIKSD